MRFTLNCVLRVCIGVVLLGYGIFFWVKLQSAWNPSDHKGQLMTKVAGEVKDNERPSFDRRRIRLEQACSNGALDSLWTTQNFIVDTKHKVAYCDVSKTGSTFWKAIFAILTGKANVTSPSYLMMKNWDDLHKIRFTRFQNLSHQQQELILTDGKLLLFARDPYMRLLSAYMDKFVRPNTFYWREYGRVIVNFLRKTKDEQSIRCGHDVTFEEFIRFFVIGQSPGKTFSTVDRHWTPIHQLCDPCNYPYAFIGKTEFMAEDAAEILSALNLNDVIHFDKTAALSVADDIERRITQFFDEYVKVQNCTNLLQLSERFWLYLTAKGYLKPHTPLPLTVKIMHNSSVSMESFKTVLQTEAFSAYSEHKFPRSIDTYSKHFASSMFAGVSNNRLLQLKKIVKRDSDLFGYNNEPGYIFSNRNFTTKGTLKM